MAKRKDTGPQPMPYSYEYEQTVIVRIEATDEAALQRAVRLARLRIPSINELTIIADGAGTARVRTRKATT